jgi:uncharacterized DUF497 family protein
MKQLSFTWDPNKNKENIRKHKISFEEAKDVFYDDDAILFDDPEHSAEEDRFLIIGRVRNLNVYVVSHCYKEKDGVIRLISARKATKKEREIYERW